MKNYNYQNLSGEKPERIHDIRIHTFRVLGSQSLKFVISK
jgi:hypothetical protein